MRAGLGASPRAGGRRRWAAGAEHSCRKTFSLPPGAPGHPHHRRPNVPPRALSQMSPVTCTRFLASGRGLRISHPRSPPGHHRVPDWLSLPLQGVHPTAPRRSRASLAHSVWSPLCTPSQPRWEPAPRSPVGVTLARAKLPNAVLTSRCNHRHPEGWGRVGGRGPGAGRRGRWAAARERGKAVGLHSCRTPSFPSRP